MASHDSTTPFSIQPASLALAACDWIGNRTADLHAPEVFHSAVQIAAFGVPSVVTDHPRFPVSSESPFQQPVSLLKGTCHVRVL